MKKGSALLIVLGMLSFMVVSAVGFSIYMRANRVPSSYLRRNVAARYLVRAALAKAVEDLEGEFNGDKDWGKVSANEQDTPCGFYGIYDDPFPGVLLNGNGTEASNPRQNGDYWLGRVFTPFGPVSSTDATVSTLTLEALAYLPPAIIDDVRRLSRLTRTASWRSLPYDAGRYAYCAVNVSDLFDINRLRANVPRNSGKDRITLASLCPKSFYDMMDLDTGMAESLDNILDKIDDTGTINGNAVPFTSLADFNFLAATAGGGNFAPFMDFIGSSDKGPLAAKKDNAATANALFITDTWFPPADVAAGETVYDLGSNAQPFKDYNANSMLEVLMSANNTDNAAKLYWSNLGMGFAALYDYLDSDSKPISLAFPTTEPVPMVVAVGAPLGLAPQIDNSDKKSNTETIEKDGYKYDVTRTVTKYSLKSLSSANSIQVKCAVMFPFKRMRETERNSANFTAYALMKVFLVKKGAGDEFKCRPVDVNLRPRERSDFNDGRKLYTDGVATFTAKSSGALCDGDNIKTVADKKWIKDITFSFDVDGLDVPVLQHVEEQWEAKDSKPDDPTPPVKKDPIDTIEGIGKKADGLWKSLYKIEGEDLKLGDPWPTGDEKKDIISKISDVPIETIKPFSQAGDYALYAAIWVQIKTGNDVVDMVPAASDDDELWLEANNGPIANRLAGGEPLLYFSSGHVINFETSAKLKETADASPGAQRWKALYAVDPRYNHAPENWFCVSDDTTLSGKWCDTLGAGSGSAKVFGHEGRDRDIFMFVSNQEYLQSIGELQFLPQLHNLKGTCNNYTADDEYWPDGLCKGQKFSLRTEAKVKDGNFADFADGDFFWRTYTAYNNGDGTEYINPYKLPKKLDDPNPVTVLSGTGGFKLNPFSRDDRVITAALIGTPFDYYVASTNCHQRVKQNNLVSEEYGGSMNLQKMMKTYSFGNGSAVLAWLSQDDLAEIAGEIKDHFEDVTDKGSADWLSAWDSLIWQELGSDKINDENKTFIAADILLKEPLHGVDRKYLYSFWRDCFDNRQQLFLIFVRAEPTSVGGGSLSRASTQLGGRAVALVWRDPAKPEKDRDGRKKRTDINRLDDWLNARKDFPPHKTRVLFYHQFD